MSSASPSGTPVSSGLNQNIAEGSGPLSQVTQVQDKTSSSGPLDLSKEKENNFGETDYWKDLTQEYEKIEKRNPPLRVK